jgi:hypothetical protein
MIVTVSPTRWSNLWLGYLERKESLERARGLESLQLVYWLNYEGELTKADNL